MKEKSFRPIMLVILDGWGISPNTQGNAIAQANLPFFDELDRFYPNAVIQASGISAGLPWNEMGNSEVGHLLLGAGQVIYQNLPRISLAIQNGSFFDNSTLNAAIEHTKKNKSAFHLMGLISSAGVHSHLDHFFAFLDLLKQENVSKVYIHIFTDGRDSSPKEGKILLDKIQERLKSIELGKIISLVGRYYAMDRNNNWDRTQKAYELLTESKADKIETDPLTALNNSYKKDITDEFIEPTFLDDKNKEKISIQDKDAIIFFNFREDRARQLTKAFVQKDFSGFKRNKVLKDIYFVSMTEYEKGLETHAAFPQKEITEPLAKILSNEGLTQLHIAETEKYAHTTYFFNGGIEKPFKNEDRILVPSPSVPNYVKTPEMSSYKITDELIEAMEKEKYDFIVVNFASPDMLGHTGNLQAAIKAAGIVDKCLEKIIKKILSKNGAAIITADHGDIEEMINLQTGEPLTEHTTNPVPIWIVTPSNRKKTRKNQEQILKNKNIINGILADIAPTILELFNIPKPKEMTGHSLLDVVK